MLQLQPRDHERIFEHVEFGHEETDENDTHAHDMNHCNLLIQENICVCYADDRTRETEERIICY